MVYIIFLCLTIPMLLMLPLLEIRSRCIVGFMLLGTVTALSAYEINTIVYPMTGLSARSFSELVPPMTEELLKAMPVLLYAVLLDDRRNRVLPIAMAVGVGFAILENSMILIDNVGSVTVLWATARGFSASLTDCAPWWREPESHTLKNKKSCSTPEPSGFCPFPSPCMPCSTC